MPADVPVCMIVHEYEERVGVHLGFLNEAVDFFHCALVQLYHKLLSFLKRQAALVQS